MDHKTRWTSQKIAQRLQLIQGLVYRRQSPLAPFHFKAVPEPMDHSLVGPEVNDNSWDVIPPMSYWGRWSENFTLRTHFTVPAEWGATHKAALYLPLGEAGDFSHPEALVYLDGKPYAACDRHHQEVTLPDHVCDGKEHLLSMQGWTGLGGFVEQLPTQLFMRPCSVVEVDQPARDFIVLARVALGVADALGTNEPARGILYSALDDAFKLLDTREPFSEAFYESLPEAELALRDGIRRAGAPMPVDLYAAGHAHIDVAWLWPLDQTRNKARRTFYNVLRLMEQYPDYHFTQSQPQLYEYMRKDDPALLEGIRKRVKEGRWEIIGGSWVECDCNLSGPESLARQFLLGRTLYKEQFGAGVDTPVLWLPDVFGYAWNLPQLIKEAGMKYFFTIKIGWSQYNRLPYDSFWWQGLDGTRVLTHFSTTPEGGMFASTYNAMASPKQIIGTWNNFQQKELVGAKQTPPLLMAYGFGDGGGGPTPEMLENLAAMKEFPSAPRSHQTKVGDFFNELETRNGANLPVWNGELYLEYHRGTYTTQSRNKRANRKSEFLLHDAEFLAALAARVNPKYKYPRETFHQAWQLVCLNQFHDIIPGSSIGPVYVESQQQYVQIRSMVEEAAGAALKAIADSGMPASKEGAQPMLVVVNPTGFARKDLAFWKGKLAKGEGLQRVDGSAVAVQASADGTWLDVGELAPFSVTPLYPSKAARKGRSSGLSGGRDHLENDLVRIEFNFSGDVSRVYDKVNQREALQAGSVGNQFQAFEDRPKDFDAWDVDIFYDDRMWTSEPAESIELVEKGPLRATLEIKRKILNSPYTQRVSLAYNSPRLDFDTAIDWRERHILLKTAFPVDVLAPQATYEIQWGNTQRPTHRNTSWDWARFETCAQKWVDLSEGGYGVSLMNDCKYGHDIREGVMRISLLRSPTMPDPDADKGEHEFAYSLLPHAGSWNEATVGAAYAVNDPLRVAEVKPSKAAAPSKNAPSGAGSFVTVDRPNVVVETVKQAEDGRGIIVRLYESQRMRGPVTLTAGFKVAQAWRANLLEENQFELEASGNQVVFQVHPYEIVTLRVVPA